jgi:hypothetical protein
MTQGLLAKSVEKRPAGRMIPFLIVVGICLAAGILLGSLAGNGLASRSSGNQPPIYFALLGYDNLQTPEQLQSVWILTLDGNGHAAYQGISPVTVIFLPGGQVAVLQKFLANPLEAPSLLYQIDRIPKPATVVEYDRQGFATIINRMGGVRIEGQLLRGQDVLNLLDASASDPLARLRLESSLVSALFGTSGPCLSESALAGLHPDHLLSNYPPDMLISECTKRGPYLSGSISVDILDHVMPMELPDGGIGLLPNT